MLETNRVKEYNVNNVIIIQAHVTKKNLQYISIHGQKSKEK